MNEKSVSLKGVDEDTNVFPALIEITNSNGKIRYAPFREYTPLFELEAINDPAYITAYSKENLSFYLDTLKYRTGAKIKFDDVIQQTIITKNTEQAIISNDIWGIISTDLSHVECSSGLICEYNDLLSGVIVSSEDKIGLVTIKIEYTRKANDNFGIIFDRKYYSGQFTNSNELTLTLVPYYVRVSHVSDANKYYYNRFERTMKGYVDKRVNTILSQSMHNENSSYIKRVFHFLLDEYMYSIRNYSQAQSTINKFNHARKSKKVQFISDKYRAEVSEELISDKLKATLGYVFDILSKYIKKNPRSEQYFEQLVAVFNVFDQLDFERSPQHVRTLSANILDQAPVLSKIYGIEHIDLQSYCRSKVTRYAKHFNTLIASILNKKSSK